MKLRILINDRDAQEYDAGRENDKLAVSTRFRVLYTLPGTRWSELAESRMAENRLIEIEMRLAEHEQTIQQLNDVITDQQARIMRLEELSRSVVERLRSLAEAADGSTSDESEPPPHY